MKAILSTRSLNKAQESRLTSAGINMVSYDALHISFLKTEIPHGYDHYIFTSKNGVKGFIRNLGTEGKDGKDITCFCVGEKTRSYLEENGFFVLKMAENASQLADFILKSDKKGPFLIFTGNRNRPELRDQFKTHGISFREVMVYETRFNQKKFDQDFRCILFFSPSGVQSYIAANRPMCAAAICIGETTAQEARKHFEKILVAPTPTTDSVIDTLIENYTILANS